MELIIKSDLEKLLEEYSEDKILFTIKHKGIVRAIRSLSTIDLKEIVEGMKKKLTKKDWGLCGWRATNLENIELGYHQALSEFLKAVEDKK